MVHMIPLLDAKKLADKNGNEHKRLLRKKQQADHRAKKAQENLNEAYTEAFENFLSPFATTFTKIKNVELDDLPTATAVPVRLLRRADAAGAGSGAAAVHARAAGRGGALLPAARRAGGGCVGPDHGDQRRAAGQARTEVAGERHCAERPRPGRSGGGVGQHDDGGAGRRR